MEQELTTKVIFRKWKNNRGIIALFPELPGSCHPGTCMSYEHVGQHGAASLSLTHAHTTLATEQEYRDLKRELESDPYGYRLKVLKRMPRLPRSLVY